MLTTDSLIDVVDRAWKLGLPRSHNLLSPIHHRSPQAQADLAVIPSRDVFMRTRTLLINHVRGIVKSFGDRLPFCSANYFATKVTPSIPQSLQTALLPILDTIVSLTQQIRSYDRQIEAISEEHYPETALLRRIDGVAPALAFILTLEDHQRFPKSRDVGHAMGLVPRRDQSGDHDHQLHITKTRNAFLRRPLVGWAQYILGPYGTDCDLRRWGLKLAERGGKNAKKRAVIAVARKLAILLHRLWKNGEVYDPFYQSQGIEESPAIIPAAV